MEVTSRTTDGTALSGVSKNTPRAFDLRTWQGLTSLLKAGRESGMDQVAYAEFRDLVLQYAQSGGSDTEIRKKLETILPSLGTPESAVVPEAVPEVKKISAAPEPLVTKPAAKDSPVSRPPSFRTRDERRVPVFGGTKIVVTNVEPKEPEVSLKDVEEKVHAITFVPTHTEPEVVTNNEAPPPAAAEPKPEAVSEVAVKDVIAPAPEVVEKEVVETSAPAARQEEVPSSTSAVKTIDEYRARISEIKRTVNAEIGNPVMLIDANNTIGREYMNALLNAMKATSGGAPGSLVSSMDALEDVFKRVMKDADALKQGGKKDTPAVPASGEETRAEATEQVIPAAVTTETKPQVHEPVSGFTGGSNEVAGEAVGNGVVKEEVEGRAPVARVIPSLADQLRGVTAKQPAIPTPPVAAPAALPSIPLTEEAPLMSKERILVPENTSPVLSPEVGKHAVRGSGLPHHDVTVPWNEKPSVPASVAEDLNAPEIDMGLEELLVQWSIFKGSGLFGTGPGGRAHPLFLKLKDLPMSAVAAGKWEKAGKDEILSIRDYINGWRHEQGVSYIPTETFDHYLRRVVKRILKRQGI